MNSLFTNFFKAQLFVSVLADDFSVEFCGLPVFNEWMRFK
ncbi:hypothetical protein RU93_GL000475 [Enterococcus aquimarinus]|uniref:Uncharacterized protein n=1 Tax=Enterococcus aquimarinus TaxID=328396 RepID=A0A1L8QQV9_9ENTE|nr:hypothetical protein RU93_GL000475 [Enterococcus aquimarinus]